MRLILVRHGETLANIAKIIQGQLPGELSFTGRQQARLLADRLKKEKISRIWSSTLKRALDTAAEIAPFHGLQVEAVPDLRERSFGLLEGKSFDDYFQALEKSGVPFHRFSPQRGESLVELEGRITRLVETLYRIARDETILLVAHGIVNKVLLKILLQQTFDDWHNIRQENTCVNILESNPRTGKLEGLIINCIRHLDNCKKPKPQTSADTEKEIRHAHLSGLSSLLGPADH